MALGAPALAGAPGRAAQAATKDAVQTAAAPIVAGQDDPHDWGWVRSQFDLLDRSLAHFDGFLLTSHPNSVRAAIDKYRIALDQNPSAGLHDLGGASSERVRPAATLFWFSSIKANQERRLAAVRACFARRHDLTLAELDRLRV